MKIVPGLFLSALFRYSSQCFRRFSISCFCFQY